MGLDPKKQAIAEYVTGFNVLDFPKGNDSAVLALRVDGEARAYALPRKMLKELGEEIEKYLNTRTNIN